MSGPNAFDVEGVVVEKFPNGTYIVGLPNGHRFRAFVTGKAKKTFPELGLGQKVSVRLSSYDLSEGRILALVRTD
jgi:translation initiation factor IF-1